ncbi:MAG: hypothetical protein ACKPKO_18240 [Candidatus Fonsibacter sp.]
MSAVNMLRDGTYWTSLCPQPIYREKAWQGSAIATSMLVGTVLEDTAGNTTKKPGVIEGSSITVNRDNDTVGKRVATMNLATANVALPDTT